MIYTTKVICKHSLALLSARCDLAAQRAIRVEQLRFLAGELAL